MKKDKYAIKFDEQQSNQDEETSSTNCFTTNYLNLSSTNHASNHSINHSANSSNHLSTHSTSDQSPELCEKIKFTLGHLTEEIKVKFTKKKNRSPNLRAKKHESHSDQENDRKCVTRIKINTNDEMDFLTNQHHLSQFNQASNLSSQNSLTESRSPFINRALPPLPRRQERDVSHENCNSIKLDDSLNCSDKNVNKSVSQLSSKPNLATNSNLSQEESDDDELNLTNCFRIYKERELKKCTSKIKNMRHFLPTTKKYPIPKYPPPHLHSSKSKVVQFNDCDDDEEEEEENEVEATSSSLINLDSNLNDNLNINLSNASKENSTNNQLNEETRKMMDYAESIEKVKGILKILFLFYFFFFKEILISFALKT